MSDATQFDGQFQLNKTLTLEQYNVLKDFSTKAHHNHTGTPGCYCDWEPTKDGNGIKHSGSEGHDHTAYICSDCAVAMTF